ncbi:hypothetical protein [Streptomyces coffeae]
MHFHRVSRNTVRRALKVLKPMESLSRLQVSDGRLSAAVTDAPSQSG